MYCECGCGQQTKLAVQSTTRTGTVRGQPQRFIRGHGTRLGGIEFVERDCGYYTPCMVWQRAISNGYGVIWRNGKTRKAHVVRWEAVNGPVLDGMVLDHLCCNRPCVREDHLEPVTHAENLRRGQERGLRIVRALVDGSLAEQFLHELGMVRGNAAFAAVRDIVHAR